MRRFALLVTLLGSLGVNVSSTTGQDLIVDRAPAPQTLEGLAGISGVVARIVVRQVGEVQRDVNPGRPPNKFVEYVATVSDLVKADARGLVEGQDVRILVMGTRLVHEKGFRILQRGEELLVFLHWLPEVEAYGVTAGPDGAFSISAGRLVPLGRSIPVRTFQRSADDVIDSLKKDIR